MSESADTLKTQDQILMRVSEDLERATLEKHAVTLPPVTSGTNTPANDWHLTSLPCTPNGSQQLADFAWTTTATDDRVITNKSDNPAFINKPGVFLGTPPKPPDSPASTKKPSEGKRGSFGQTAPAVVEAAKFIPWRIWWGEAVVYVAAFLLTFNAGFLNGAGYSGFQKGWGSITSQSGTFTSVALYLQRDDWDKTYGFFGMFCSFIIGSTICGIYIPEDNLQIGKQKYGIALFNSALFIGCATYFENREFSKWLVAMACGLQNGMATQYSGHIIRSTHVTGTVTDIGLLFGRLLGWYLRGVDAEQSVEFWKIRFLLLLVFGFFSGAFTGSALWDQWGQDALWLPTLLSATLGLTYTTYRRMKERREQSLAQV